MAKNAYNLIGQERVSVGEVVNELLTQKAGTTWAEKTNQFAINYVRDLTKAYGDSWFKGKLPEDIFNGILLPKHEHKIEQDSSFIFPLDTPVGKALDYYKNTNSLYAKECLEAIKYLKEEIRKNGFTSPIVLVVIGGTIKHVDGLHRMLALKMLLEEGFEYKPIQVYLCNPLKWFIPYFSYMIKICLSRKTLI